LLSSGWQINVTGVEDGTGINAKSSSAGTALNSGNLTTTNASDMIAGFGITGSTSGISTTGTNLTQREGTRFYTTGSTYEGYSGDYTVSSTGSYDATLTANASVAWIAQAAAYICSGTCTHVQGAASTSLVAAASPWTLSLSGVGAGHLLVVNVANGSNTASFTVTANNSDNCYPATSALNNGSVAGTSQQWYCPNVNSGSTTVSFAWTGGVSESPWFTVDEYSGVAVGSTGNVWTIPTVLTAEPYSVWFNHAPGTLVASVAAITAAGDWYWANQYLYVYSTSNPATAFTSPGVEIATYYGIQAKVAYTTIENLNITESYPANVQDVGGTNPIVVNNTISNSGNVGGLVGKLVSFANSSSVAVNSSQVTNNTLTGNYTSHAVVLFSSAGTSINGCLVEYNQISNIGGQGWGTDQYTGGTISNCIFEHNVCSYVGWNAAEVSSPCASPENNTGTGNIIAYNINWFSGYEPNGTAGYMSRGFGTDVVGVTYGANATIAYNISVGDTGACLFSAGTPNSFYNNTCYNNVTNCGLSPHCGSEGEVALYSDGSGTFNNNIFDNILPSVLYATNHTPSPTPTFDYNRWAGGTEQSGGGPWNNNGTNYANFAAWQGAGYDAHGTYASLQLTNPSLAVPGSTLPPLSAFALLMTDPGVAAGTNVSQTVDFFGYPVIPGFVSQGALQYQPKPGVSF
jgi:hypothetical protein